MNLHSGGEVVAVTSELGWVTRLIDAQVGADDEAAGRCDPSVRVHIEANSEPFSTASTRVITRGAYGSASHVLLHNAGGSGFDLRVSANAPTLNVVARYRPAMRERIANRILGERFSLLAAQILIHYPVLWRAGRRGRVPLHAAVLRTEIGTVLLAGPGGVGKSRLVSTAMATGAVTTADNLCVADAAECFGVAEPLRTHAPGTGGTRTSHGRVSVPFAGRASSLAPDRLVVLERGDGTATTIVEIDPADAAQALVAGTYAAGELRRYWAFAATLALATGRGLAHPPIDDVATNIAYRMPCLRVRVGDGDRISIAQLCAVGTAARGARRLTTRGTVT